LFRCISRIVDEYSVAYVKWDMNRDIHHPGSAGRGAIHRQTHAVYALMQKLRSQHTALEIESCSSGGGRADYGVLRHADRLWPTDSNDAGDRQQVQRGASYFFPPSVIGTHVGPRTCHITRRVYSMEYRAATALFGHMGIELDPEQETTDALETLQQAVSMYKLHRALIHDGDYVRLDSSDYLNVVGVVARDKGEALFSCAKTANHGTTLPGRFRFAGLDPARRYRMRLIWPRDHVSVTSPSIVEAADLLGEGATFSGESLLVHGVQLPLVHPDTCLVYHFAEVAH
ncbi:MAG: alpha-galactosidase, partial [Pseudomonadota bacterium]